jgi:hypothetical protein
MWQLIDIFDELTALERRAQDAPRAGHGLRSIQDLGPPAGAWILRHDLRVNRNFKSRIHFLAGHSALWTMGQQFWNLVAMSIFVFY